MGIVLCGGSDTNAWRVQWMLNELGPTYEQVDFDIHGPEAKDDRVYREIVRLNPPCSRPGPETRR